MPTTLKDEAAIIGIGQSKFSKNFDWSSPSISMIFSACERSAQRPSGTSVRFWIPVA